MVKKPIPYLCGGTFFVLLTEAKGKALTRRQLNSGKKDRVSNKNMLEALVRFFIPSFCQPPMGRTFEGDTSDYRACKVSYGVNLPFNDNVEVDGFDRRMKNQYQTLSGQMDTFVDNFLQTDSDERMQWLVQALLTLIDKDMTIAPETLFYTSASPITKTELLSLDHYCLSSLLLAIWHFIITERPDNIIGRDTFEAWHRRSGETNGRWSFITSIGKTYPKEISIELFSSSGETEAEAYREEIKKGPAEEAEPEETSNEAETENNMPEQTLVNNGRIYQQHAETIYNIEHINVFNG